MKSPSLFGESSGVTRSAIISDCGQYRYTLGRGWAGVRRPACLFVMLNPSTADGEKDDPTIRRCVGFARDWGYGSIVVVNLFAVRATEPREMMKHPEPIGLANDQWIVNECQEAGIIVAAWGAHGGFMGRDQQVIDLLTGDDRPVHSLGLTGHGYPRHPLYVPSEVRPQLFKLPGDKSS